MCFLRLTKLLNAMKKIIRFISFSSIDAFIVH